MECILIVKKLAVILHVFSVSHWGGNGGVPIVEDDVTVYTGAVVAGNITLHKGCTIAANAYVGHDVNENQLVAGVPAKHIK